MGVPVSREWIAIVLAAAVCVCVWIGDLVDRIRRPR